MIKDGFPPILFSVVRTGCLFCLACCFALAASAEDVIFLAHPKGEPAGADSPRRYTGSIIDYNGNLLIIQTPTGQQRKFPAHRVLSIESRWSDDHEAGDQSLAAGNFAQAITRYRSAIKLEKREWVRRKILSQLVVAHAGRGEPEQACRMFLLLVNSDPQTPYLSCIPLAWTPTDKVSQTTAQGWLEQNDNPAAVLLGASYLLPVAPQSATAALENIMRDKSLAESQAGLVALAEAQLWRSELFRADPQKVAFWQRSIETMPRLVRGGPYFLLATAQRRLGEKEAATISFLQVGILHASQPELVARSLLAAGEILSREDRTQEAQRIYQEVTSRFPNSRWQTEAQDRLQQLAGGKR